jgi:hypothetical protein
MPRVTLTYNDDFGAPPPNSFWLLRDGFTIRVCLREPESTRRMVEIPLRYRKPREGARLIRQMDAEASSWLVESSQVHSHLPHTELMLVDVPAIVATAFWEL